MGNEDNVDDTDNDVDVEGGGAVALLSASAAQHRSGEKERMRWF